MKNARRTERVKLRNAANYSVMHRDDAAGKSIISGEIFLTQKKKRKRKKENRGEKDKIEGRGFTRWRTRGERRGSLQKRARRPWRVK